MSSPRGAFGEAGGSEANGSKLGAGGGGGGGAGGSEDNGFSVAGFSGLSAVMLKGSKVGVASVVELVSG